VLEAVQVSAPFVVLNTPAAVPAYNVELFDGSIASEVTFVFVKPLLTGTLHDVPEFVLLLTPEAVAMYTVDGLPGSIRMVRTLRTAVAKPYRMGIHDAPVSVLLKIPPASVPA
jgi:hypothetical protein